MIDIALKRKVSFDELVNENRKQILEDRKLMDKIEERLEQEIYVPKQKSN